MPDGTARESSLHGKQLVFLFMSVVVLAVVVFLCGVMVGRGVRDAAPATELVQDLDPTITEEAGGVPTPSAPTAGERQALQYPDGLTAEFPAPDPPLEPVDESEPSPRVQPIATASAEPRPEDVRAPRVDAVSAGDFREPTGAGFVVQVHAARQQSEAVGIAKRLASKGYRAFVTTSGTGPARMFRVRVGKFSDRGDAKAVSDKLEAEEHFKPWITR